MLYLVHLGIQTHNFSGLSVEKAKEELSPEFFQILAYHLDPDSIYGNDKSWYGLTRAVLQWSEKKIIINSKHAKSFNKEICKRFINVFVVDDFEQTE
jgi:hypothetical protein